MHFTCQLNNMALSQHKFRFDKVDCTRYIIGSLDNRSIFCSLHAGDQTGMSNIVIQCTC